MRWRHHGHHGLFPDPTHVHPRMLLLRCPYQSYRRACLPRWPGHVLVRRRHRRQKPLPRLWSPYCAHRPHRRFLRTDHSPHYDPRQPMLRRFPECLESLLGRGSRVLPPTSRRSEWLWSLTRATCCQWQGRAVRQTRGPRSRRRRRRWGSCWQNHHFLRERSHRLCLQPQSCERYRKVGSWRRRVYLLR